MLLVAASLQWAIASNADDKVRSELTSSARVIDRIWSMRSQELDSVARPLALDFGFREAVATDDDATIRSALTTSPRASICPTPSSSNTMGAS